VNTMDVKIKFSTKDKRIAKLAKQLREANYTITISRPFHGSVPIMWVDEACYTGSKKVVQAATELLGKNK